ncbi:thiamine-binding protein [Halorubellus sp. JP-L1]|uniref:thiamine-binding protein n=1 Tax=Halorubellus sp. JP-L1 TaxID=2715753 RepID=UPI00140B4368|nr:thiamine-binding protein [Halorubellus sp. JP-L1]NHN43554.1 thiamine-binding protein [Halorubellus sp. JP-L1]
MTVFGMLRITPVTDDDVTEEVAAAVDALEEHDVAYETNAMSTVVEADDLDALLAAVGDAHRAVAGDHVNTLLQIDDDRTSDITGADKVEKVESELGRDAASDRD